MRRLVALTLVLVAGCSFSPDQAPRPIDGLDLSDGVPVIESTDGDTEATLWYVDGTRLVPVGVPLASGDPADLVTALLAGRGLGGESVSRSSIPPGTALLGIAIDGGVVTLDLTRDFTLVGGDEELLAVGQIVLTATEARGVEGVLLTIDGDPVEAPTAEGALVGRPLARQDFDARIVG